MGRLSEFSAAEAAYLRGETSEVREGAELLDLCRALGRWLHREQVDKQGAPYVEHLGRVAAGVAGDELAECAAWLHDAVEDYNVTRVTLDDLSAIGLPDELIDTLDNLSRGFNIGDHDPEDEPYAAYISRILDADDPIAVRVKLADLADNLDPSRGPIPDSLRRRYEEAQRILREAWPE